MSADASGRSRGPSGNQPFEPPGLESRGAGNTTANEGGGKLQRERQPIQPLADPVDGGTFSSSTLRSGRTALARAEGTTQPPSCGGSGGTSIRCSPRIRAAPGWSPSMSTKARSPIRPRPRTRPRGARSCPALAVAAVQIARRQRAPRIPWDGVMFSTRASSETITPRRESGRATRSTLHP